MSGKEKEMAEEKLDETALQTEIQKAGGDWLAGKTSMSELSNSEQVKYLGFVPKLGEDSLEVREQISQSNLAAFKAEGMMAFGYPSAYDLRNVGGRNYITSVKNQGSCGSCVAFGAAATAEGTYRRQRNDPNLNIDFSEAHLFYCIAKSQNRNCGNGWWVAPALDAFKNPGIVDEASFPYTAGDQNCNLPGGWQQRVTKITNWHKITNVSQMKQWLSTKGPLAACYTVYQDFFSYRSGIYRHVSGARRGGHCVSCVGYNDAQGYWIMKNSWGSGFGEAGFFRIAYGQCGIDSDMWAVDSIEDTAWHKGKKITGLWAINENRNAWAYVSGIGWKKIANNNDNIFNTMLSQLVAAKAGNRNVNLYLEKGMIKQVYVL
jgi:C1A family cysteine protease